MGFLDVFKKREAIEAEALQKAEQFIKEKIDEHNNALLQKAEDIKLKSLTDRGYYDREGEFSTPNKTVNLQNYERYVWTYAAVYAIASCAAQTPLRVYGTNPDGTRGEEIIEGRFWDLVNKPNPFQTGYDLIEATISSLELTGDVFLEKGGLTPEQPSQLYVLRPDWVEIIPDPKQLVKQYLYRTNSKTITFQPNEIIHTKYYHPRSELYGLSPIEPAGNSLVLDLYTIKYQKNFFSQGGMINTYVSVPTSLSDTDFERLKRQFRTEYSGVDRAHLLGLIDNDGEIKSIGTDPKNLLLTEQRRLNRDEILAAFGVPPVMVGLLDAATFNNTAEQKKAFWQNTMKPKLKKIQDKFNQILFWPYNVECEFDLSNVEALKEDEKVKADTAVALVGGGIMTPNEARKKFFQLEALPGGETLKTTTPPAFPAPIVASAAPVVTPTKELLPAVQLEDEDSN